MNSKVRLAKRFPLRKEHPIGMEKGPRKGGDRASTEESLSSLS